MLGTDGVPRGGVDALGGDTIDELLDRIEKDTGGGNGSGNNGGGDPYDAPVSVRMLLATAKQIAEAMTKIGERNLDATEKLTDATLDAIRNERAGMLEVAKQLHENAMAYSQENARLAHAAGDCLESLVKRVGALERELAILKTGAASASFDVGGGP
jgi:hypothetical protein